MKKSLRNILAAMAFAVCATASADDYNRLFIIGEATPGGWSLDDAQALLAKPSTPNVYTGTLFLKNTGDFKFMSVPEWGNLEYGLPTDATNPVSGDFKLASGNNDEGYLKLSVATTANYYIEIDTENMTGSITLSPYQSSNIEYTSLYLIGDATKGGWSADAGTPLYQSKDTPYVYSNEVELKNGTFKIFHAVKGAGSFDSKYYFFRDADNAGKISTDGTGDLQWSIDNEGFYNVTVDTNNDTIDIAFVGTDSIVDIIASDDDTTAVYYNLQGQKVANPNRGVYIKVAGNKAEKIVI